MDNRVPIKVRYTNHKGETAMRQILPLRVFFGNTAYHAEDQWMLEVFDLGKQDYRTYAMKNIQEWHYGE